MAVSPPEVFKIKERTIKFAGCEDRVVILIGLRRLHGRFRNAALS